VLLLLLVHLLRHGVRQQTQAFVNLLLLLLQHEWLLLGLVLMRFILLRFLQLLLQLRVGRDELELLGLRLLYQLLRLVLVLSLLLLAWLLLLLLLLPGRRCRNNLVLSVVLDHEFLLLLLLLLLLLSKWLL